MANESKSPKPIFDRSDKSSNAISRFIFCLIRAIDPYIQQILIFNGYGHQILSLLGIATSSGPKGTVLDTMAAGCALKQIINMLFILEPQIPVSSVVIICIYNTVLNSQMNSVKFYQNRTNRLF